MSDAKQPGIPHDLSTTRETPDLGSKSNEQSNGQSNGMPRGTHSPNDSPTDYKNDVYIQNRCSHCRSTKLMETPRPVNLVCSDCATVQNTPILKAEVVKIDPDRKVTYNYSTNCQFKYANTLGSDIGYYKRANSKDSRGSDLSPGAKWKYSRLARWYHRRLSVSTDITHARTIGNYRKVVSKLEIPESISRRAVYLYYDLCKKAEKDNKEITNHMLLIALSLLIAVRESKDRSPIRFAEVVNAFADNQHRVTNKNILKLAQDLDVNLAPTRRKSEDYVERICAAVASHDEVVEKLEKRSVLNPLQYEMYLVRTTQRFLELLTRRERGGVQPYAFAVTTVYLADRALNKAMGRKKMVRGRAGTYGILTQPCTSDAADSAEFTIRDHIYRFMGDLYDEKEEHLLQFVDDLIAEYREEKR